MALQEFGKGILGGLSPLMKQHQEGKKAESELARKLKHMEKMGKLELQLKREAEDMEYENIFTKLKGVGVSPEQATLGGLGQKFEAPLGQRGQQTHDLGIQKMLQDIEASKSLAGQREQMGKYYGTGRGRAGDTSDARLRWQFQAKALLDELDKVRPEVIIDEETGAISEKQTPEMKRKQKAIEDRLIKMGIPMVQIQEYVKSQAPPYMRTGAQVGNWWEQGTGSRWRGLPGGGMNPNDPLGILE